jgi:hypothetical protein
MPFEYLDEETPQSKFEYLDEEPVMQLPPKPSVEPQNILGQIFNVPGAAIRSGLMGRGYTAGAINPSQVPKFQNLAINAVQKSTNPLVNVAIGMPASGIGMATDILTQPADVLSLLVGKTPLGGGKTLGGVVSELPMVKALGRFMGRERTFVKPLLNKEDQFLLQQSDDIYNVTQKAKSSVQQEYATFRDATKDTPVDLGEINTSVKKLYGKTAKDVGEILPEDFTKEIKLIADEAKDSNLDVVYKVKDTISKHIKPTTWRKFKMGEQLTPDQEKLIGAYFDFDKLIDNSLQKAGMLEEKQMLDYLNQKATDLYGVTGQVKKMVTNTLGQPQKTSEIRSVFLGKGNAGKKALFQQLSEFEPQILDITKGLEKYRSMQNTRTLLKRIGIIAGTGTLVGGVGGRIGWEMLKEK